VSDLALTCSGLTELVTDYVEHVLDPRRTLSFEAHMVFCPGCRVFLSQTREAIDRLHAVPQEPPPPVERDAILAAYRKRT
jgi:putative zinc finger protein